MLAPVSYYFCIKNYGKKSNFNLYFVVYLFTFLFSKCTLFITIILFLYFRCCKVTSDTRISFRINNVFLKIISYKLIARKKRPWCVRAFKLKGTVHATIKNTCPSSYLSSCLSVQIICCELSSFGDFSLPKRIYF